MDMAFPFTTVDDLIIYFRDGIEILIPATTQQAPLNLYGRAPSQGTPSLIQEFVPGDRIIKGENNDGSATFAFVSGKDGVGFLDRSIFDEDSSYEYFLYVGFGITFLDFITPNQLAEATYWGLVNNEGTDYVTGANNRIATLVNKIANGAPDLQQANVLFRPALTVGISGSEKTARFGLTGSSQEAVLNPAAFDSLTEYASAESYSVWCSFNVTTTSVSRQGLVSSFNDTWGIFVSESNSPNFFSIGCRHFDALENIVQLTLTGAYENIHHVNLNYDGNTLSMIMDNVSSASVSGVANLDASTMSSSYIELGEGNNFFDTDIVEVVTANAYPGAENTLALTNYFISSHSLGPVRFEPGPMGDFPTQLSGVTYWGRFGEHATPSFGEDRIIQVMTELTAVNPSYSLNAPNSADTPISATYDRRKGSRAVQTNSSAQYYTLFDDITGFQTFLPVAFSTLVQGSSDFSTDYHFFTIFRVRSSSLPPKTIAPQLGRRIFGYEQSLSSLSYWGAHVRSPTIPFSESFTYDYELTTTTINSNNVTSSNSHFLYFDHLYLLEFAASGNYIRTSINDGFTQETFLSGGPGLDSVVYVGPFGNGTSSLNVDIFEVATTDAFSSGSTNYERVRNYFEYRYNFGLVPEQPTLTALPSILNGGTFWFDGNTSDETSTLPTGSLLTGSIPNLLSTTFGGLQAHLTGADGSDTPLVTSISGNRAIQFNSNVGVSILEELAFAKVGGGPLTNQDALGTPANGSTGWHFFMVFFIPEEGMFQGTGDPDPTDHTRLIGNSQQIESTGSGWGVYGNQGGGPPGLPESVQTYMLSGSVVTTSHSVQFGVPQLIEWWQTGSFSYSRLNDGLIASASGGRIEDDTLTGELFLGGREEEGFFSGSIMEVYIASASNRQGDADNTAILQVRNYFANKYNIPV